MLIAFAWALSTTLLGAAASEMPGIDLQKTCRAAEKSMIESFGNVTDRTNYESCVKSEQSARDQLVKDWSTYPAADRAQCIHTRVYMPSYVEWLTCLEMARDVRKIQRD